MAQYITSTLRKAKEENEKVPNAFTTGIASEERRTGKKKGRNERGARYVHGGGSSGKTPGIRDGIANEHGKKRQIAEERRTTEKMKGETIEAHATFTVEGRAVKHPVSATASPRGK